MTRPRREEEEIIDEIRRARAEIWREAGGTAEGLVRLLSAPLRTAGPDAGRSRKPKPGRVPSRKKRA